MFIPGLRGSVLRRLMLSVNGVSILATQSTKALVNSALQPLAAVLFDDEILRKRSDVALPRGPAHAAEDASITSHGARRQPASWPTSFAWNGRDAATYVLAVPLNV